MTRMRLGDILLDNNIITKQQLDVVLSEQKQTKNKLGDILLEKGYIKEQELIEVLEFQLGIPHVSLYNYSIDQSITKLIDQRFAVEHQVLPIKKEKNRLTVAMADPLDYYAIDDLRMITGLLIEPVIASKSEINTVINRIYSIQDTVSEIMDYLPKDEELNEQLSSDDSPVSRMVNQILKNAVQVNASDVHFDPHENNLLVRFRIDGLLQTEQILAKSMQSIITTRIKIMSNLNIAEKRLPQDGRFKMDVDFRTIDIRVSTLPTINGEKVVLRILDLTRTIQQLEQLGFLNENAEKLRSMIHKAYGLLLVTGPTGSGKTSTLYAALNELNKDDVNVITIEDPVEFQLKGVNQIQVNEKIGLSFIKGLRTVLRQDPDIIMIGEVRDAETVEMAIRSALTGHIVLSTIHTNDAVSCFTRLLDMGVEPYVIVSSLSGVVAQRLVRKICSECSEEYIPSIEEKALMEKHNITMNLRRGKGCAKCNKSGYRGRIAIHELVVLDDELKRMIINKQPDSDYREYLKQKGFVSMQEDGLKKVQLGITTISEVMSVTMVEGND